MPKPDYKGAEKDILALLETVPEPTTPSSNNRIIDVTEDSLGTVYQFTENELLVIKDTSKGDKDEKKKTFKIFQRKSTGISNRRSKDNGRQGKVARNCETAKKPYIS